MMSLVDTTEKKPELKVRVFRRKDNKLILCWNYLPILSGKRPRINARNAKTNEVTDVTAFTLDEKAQDSSLVDTVICLIDEVKAQTSPDTKYFFTVWYSGLNISGRRAVEPEGVYPSHDPERREQNVHLYGWDERGKVWRKVGCVQGDDGGFYLGTVAINNKTKNGYADEEKL